MKKYHWWIVFAVLVVARFVLATRIVGFSGDIIYFFATWGEKLGKEGLSQAYVGGTVDYPPLYLYPLWLLSHFIDFAYSSSWWDSKLNLVLMATPAILADIGIAYLAFKLVKEKTDSIFWQYLIPSIILICPTMLVNSVYWKQIESIYTLFIALSIYNGLKKKLVNCATFYILSILCKPQAAILAPIILIFAYEGFREKKYAEIICALVVAVLTMFIVCLPVSPDGFNIWWVWRRIFKTFNQYPYFSLNADNLYQLLGQNFVQFHGTFWKIFKIAVPAIFTVAIWYLWKILDIKRETKAYFLAGFLAFLVYFLMPEMHERYSYPVVVFMFLAFATSLNMRIFTIWIITTIASWFNHLQILIGYKWGGGKWRLAEFLSDKGNMVAIIFAISLIYCFVFIVQQITLKRSNYELPEKSVG